MATSQEIQRTNIINTIEAMNMVSFAINDVPKIMINLGVLKMNYFIGGSIAAMLHGINLSRNPHDIDIIVKEEDFDRIKRKLEDSFYYKVLPIDPCDKYNDKGNISHIPFMTAESPQLDILCNKFLEVETMRDRSIKLSTETLSRIASLQELVKAKKYFNRAKDKEDLVLLQKALDKIEKHLTI